MLVSTPQWVAFASFVGLSPPLVGHFAALYGSFLTIFMAMLPPTLIGSCPFLFLWVFFVSCGSTLDLCGSLPFVVVLSL